VTGPPGSGKSTVSRLLAERCERSALVEGDAFFAFLAAGRIDPWLPESDEQNRIVTEAAAVATGHFVTSGYDTYYDGVLGPWFLDPFIRASGLTELDYAILLPPVEACVERVRTRRNHGFSDEAAARKMHTEFAKAPIDPRHVVGGDAAASPAEVADAIEVRRSERRLRVHPPPST